MFRKLLLGPFSAHLHLLAFLFFVVALFNHHPAHAEVGADVHRSVPRWTALAGPVFQHWSSANGLPKAEVKALVQDFDGFLWMSTDKGLTRWDGYHFRIYQHTKEPGSLPDSNVTCIHVDRKGRLWVGTEEGGLALYDHEHDRFINMLDGVRGARHVGVLALEDDGDGGLWLGTVGGLDHFIPERGTISHYDHDEGAGASYPDGYVRVLLRDKAGNLWIGTNQGLLLRPVRSEAFSAVALHVSDDESVGVTSLAQSSDGRIWVGTSGQGVFVVDAAGRVPRALALEHGSLRLDTERITAICEVSKGEIWLGTFGDGVLVVDDRGTQLKRVRKDDSLPTSLADDEVHVIKRDGSGMVWIGTKSGVSRTVPLQSGIRTMFGNAVWPGSLTESTASSITSMSDGSIWVGLPNKGIDIIDSATQHVESILPDRNAPERSLPGSTIYAVSEPRKNVAFVATRDGLFGLSTRTYSAWRVMLAKGNSRSPIQAMCQIGNTLWLGGEDGLWRLDITDPNHVVASRAQGAEELNRQNIWVLQKGAQEELWIGSVHGGLFRYRYNTHDLDQYTKHPSDPNSLSHNFVSSLLLDRNNRLWVGSLGGGISVWDTPDDTGPPQFRQIGAAQGLNPTVNKILEDSRGRIWASTDSGLAVINPDNFLVRTLQRGDGVHISEYLVNDGARTARGELLFGGKGGMTIVRPELFDESKHPAPIVITDIEVGGKPVASSLYNGMRQVKPTPLVVAPDRNSVSVEFAVLDYAAPERNRYMYKLEGYDRDWIDPDPAQHRVTGSPALPAEGDYRVAVYHNLPPGEYLLHVRGTNHSGDFMGPEKVLPIRVLPDWYQTWWMRMFGVLIVAMAIYALVQIRTYYLRMRQRSLERSVDQRTRELQESRSELLEKNIELARLNKLQEEQQSELTRFLAVASHDLRQPMHALNLYLEALTNFEVDAAGRPVLDSARHCAQILDDMFAALLDLSRLDARAVDPIIKPFPVLNLLERVAVEFEPLAQAKSIKLSVIPSRLWAKSDPALIEQLLRNLISNAVRYTERGGVLIGCRRHRGKVRIAVYDTGIGIAREQQKTVFEEFFQVGSRSRDRNAGLGLGLAIVRRIARLLGTAIVLKSQPGKGSMFAIDLPRVVKPKALGRGDQPGAIDFGEQSEAEQSPGQDVNALAAHSPLAGKLAVVVEDEDAILGAMQVLLTQWGCEVVLAKSSHEAVQRLDGLQRCPDVLICDFELRTTETGIDVIHLLRDEFNHEIPALLITGAVANDQLQELQKQGLTILHKPVNAQELQVQLRTVLRSAEVEHE